jgi:hypothetical protein
VLLRRRNKIISQKLFLTFTRHDVMTHQQHNTHNNNISQKAPYQNALTMISSSSSAVSPASSCRK